MPGNGAASGGEVNSSDDDEHEPGTGGGAADEEGGKATGTNKKKKRGTKGKARKTRQLAERHDQRATLQKNRNADFIGACRGEGFGSP